MSVILKLLKQMKRAKNKEELINGAKLKIGIVVSRFNEDITQALQKGAIKVLGENGVKENSIKTVWVPGSFEIPLACQKLAKTGEFDALIALGCVIKGETDHYYFVADQTSSGIMEVMLKYNIPVGFGILTTNNLEQAQKRCSAQDNKGEESAQAVLEVMKNTEKN